jgi:Ca2+/Na+ antiporter
MFTELYLRSTDPEISLNELLKENIVAIIISVIFHTIVYLGFANLVSFVFINRGLSYRINIRLTVVLLLIMFFGYIARYYHVQDIYRAYNYDKTLTRTHLDKLYIGWIFIG